MAFIGFTSPSLADESPQGSTSFRATGGVGLMEMPTARMAAQNTIAAGVGYLDPIGHAFITWQAMPWLETTARLTDVRGVGDDLDRSLDLKIRLFDETRIFPAVAVGFQDFLGHGPTSAEYLAFSKTSGNFDITLGFSWGYLGSRGGIGNPMKTFGNVFDVRDQTKSGTPAFKNFFAGNRMGIYAGLAYRTPIDGLELKLEYSGIEADKVNFGRAVDDQFPLNAGLSYRPFRWLEMGAGFVRGKAFSFNLVFRSEPLSFGTIHQPKSPPLPVSLRASSVPRSDQGKNFTVPASSQVAHADGGAATRVSKALFDAGIEAPLFELRGDKAYLTASLPISSAPHQSLAAAYLTFANLPPDIDTLILRNRLADDLGTEGQTFTRDLVMKLARADAAFDDLLKAGGVSELTVTGKDVTASTESPLAPDEETVAALADLAPAGGGIGTIKTTSGRDGTASIADLRRERAATHLQNYFAEGGLEVADIRVADGAAADGPLDEKALREMTAAGLAILAASGDGIKSMTLLVRRGGEVIATAEAPSGKITAAKGALQTGGEPARSGMRYLPLFGYVAWRGPQQTEAPKMTGVSAPLTAGEAAQMFAAAKHQGLAPVAARAHDGVTELAVTSHGLYNPATIVGRAGRAIASAAPSEAQRIAVTLVADGVGLGRASFWRTDLEKAANGVGSAEEVWLHTEIDRGETAFDSAEGWHRAETSPRFQWHLIPELQQHFGAGSEGGYKAGAYVTLAAKVEPWDGFALDGAVKREVAGNLEDILPRSGTAVPHVRSDIGRYAQEGKTAIARLVGSYTRRPYSNLFVRASAGLYEPMYGGAGIEALWRPEASDWAIGADMNWVKQRDFDQLFGFRSYTAWTGHLSLYRHWQASGLRGVVRVGRYLAEDFGATFELSREFRSGIRISAWATLTDMKRQDFGPDSFAKGLTVAIPLDLVMPWSWLGTTTLPFTVLNRDGGQRLNRGPDLYDLTSPGGAAALADGWGGLMR